MPRLPNAWLRQAYGIDPLLARLLPECRTLEDAQNELRWLREHVVRKSTGATQGGDDAAYRCHSRLRWLCDQRARGVPLQYLLGSEYFGPLEIVCRPGVLIPRPETAATTAFLASRLLGNRRNLPSRLRVLDLCTGTGCIPLLLRHAFASSTPANDGPLQHPQELDILGVDIAPDAIDLARSNEARLAHPPNSHQPSHPPPPHTTLRFERADILANTSTQSQKPSLQTLLTNLNAPTWDILISNPPYISPLALRHTTSRSVRRHEPKLALVPPPPPAGSRNPDQAQADLFYPRLLHTAQAAGAKLALVEVADTAQALRVARLAARSRVWAHVEIWRDGDLQVPGRHTGGFATRGGAAGRAVLCYRGEGRAWLALE